MQGKWVVRLSAELRYDRWADPVYQTKVGRCVDVRMRYVATHFSEILRIVTVLAGKI